MDIPLGSLGKIRVKDGGMVSLDLTQLTRILEEVVAAQNQMQQEFVSLKEVELEDMRESMQTIEQTFVGIENRTREVEDNVQELFQKHTGLEADLQRASETQRELHAAFSEQPQLFEAEHQQPSSALSLQPVVTEKAPAALEPSPASESSGAPSPSPAGAGSVSEPAASPRRRHTPSRSEPVGAAAMIAMGMRSRSGWSSSRSCG